MKYSGKYQNGFTLTEVITVLIVLGILSAVVYSRSNNMEASLYSEAEVIKTHLRYAQTQAMNKTNISSNLVWGFTCDGTYYWLFKSTNPASNIDVLPDNAAGSDKKVVLAAKKVSMSSFTVFFDGRGVPYSAYTDKTTNTPLTASLDITITPQGKLSPSKTINITPLTGYIP